MRYEIQKMFWYHKGLLLILLYILLNISATLLFDHPANQDVERNREAYYHYLHMVEGECTSETEVLLSEEAKKIFLANSELQRLYNDFYDGKLTEQEFELQKAADEETIRYQKGFEILYEQYSGIRENKDNRWFLYTNGWEGLLSHDSLELSFILLLFLLIIPVFCQEYESKMDDLIKTECNGTRYHALCKVILVVLVVSLLCLLNSSIQYLFYECKYGLLHGDYPLQSLSYFSTSTREVTLMEAFHKICLGKLFGNLYLSILILCVSVCVKSSSLTFFLSSSVILLPYYGLTMPSAKYLLPGPLGFLLSTGFFKGNEFEYDVVTQEKVMIFQEVGGTERELLFSINLCMMLLMVLIILKRHTNIWCKRRTYHVNKSHYFVIMLCIMIQMLSGCSVSNKIVEYSVYNLEQSSFYENSNYRFFLDRSDPDKLTWMMEKKSTGEIQYLVRNPLQASVNVLDRIYGCGDFIYYVQVDSYETGFFSVSSHFSVVEVDTRDFKERIVFERNLDINQNTILSNKKTSEEDLMLFTSVEGLFLDNQNLYLIGHNQVNKVDLVTGKTDLILEAPLIKSLSFDGESIYYINEKSQLMKYNINSRKEEGLYDIITNSFLLYDSEMIFMNRLDKNKLYSINLDNGLSSQLTEKAVLCFEIVGNTLIYIGKTDLQEQQILLNQ